MDGRIKNARLEAERCRERATIASDQRTRSEWLMAAAIWDEIAREWNEISKAGSVTAH